MLPYICEAWEMAEYAKNRRLNYPTTWSHWPDILDVMFYSSLASCENTVAHLVSIHLFVRNAPKGLVCGEMVYGCVVVGQAEGGLGEGQGCVYNVNTVKTTNTKGRGKERGGPHPLTYILFQLVVLHSYWGLKNDELYRLQWEFTPWLCKLLWIYFMIQDACMNE